MCWTISIFDSGSTVSFIDQSLVNVLNLKSTETVLSVAGTLGLSDFRTRIKTAKVGSSENETSVEDVTFCSHPYLKVGEKLYDFRTLKKE